MNHPQRAISGLCIAFDVYPLLFLVAFEISRTPQKYEWKEWNIDIPLEQKKNDPFRSWTENKTEKGYVVVNGLQISVSETGSVYVTLPVKRFSSEYRKINII